MTQPTEPTLTCSEVVERLAAWFDNLEAGARSTFKATDDEYSEGRADAYKNAAHHLRTQAPAILHSWRERRVQELENLLAKHSGCSHCADSASRITSTNDSTEIRESK